MADNDVRSSLLDVSNLAIKTKTRTLVADFNLSMKRGDRVGLIGESGSGKSMTASALMGPLPEGASAQGSIQLAGHPGNLVDASDKELQKIRGKDMAMVFQEPLTALNPLMKVGRQVAEIMTTHKVVATKAEARKRAVELLASVKLPDPERAARAYPHQLSGGQRQRAMLAMALANDPGLLLCDEPTTALDVTVRRQVLELIQESVAERGTGLLFITHDLSVVANVCDRVLVMNNGRIVEEGSTAQVFSNPQHPYTRGLLAASDLNATDAEGRLFTVASAAAYTPPTIEDPQAQPQAQAEAEKPAATAAPQAAAEGNQLVISVKDLVRTYPVGRTALFGKPGEVQALRGISFDVAAGQRFGVVGESGSGKSTLLRILAGLDQPTSGGVQVAGNQIAGAKEKDLAAAAPATADRLPGSHGLPRSAHEGQGHHSRASAGTGPKGGQRKASPAGR
ncbi:ATP-binding cassette domain-containing protein [Glutamicibacter halophytocola]|uniref:ATP-binding cassette domain-containing protein n=1 Tax=Glutamicibacter halophytocola TaxID=1933880 RepID=UPI0032192BC8